MSALRMVAWGMVKLEDLADENRYHEWKALRDDVRQELRPHGYWLGVPKIKHGKRPRDYRLIYLLRGGNVIHEGTSSECCRRMLGILEPHNYPSK